MQPKLKLLTTGHIAAILKRPTHRVNYILATRPHIRPKAFAGNVRLYDRRALAMIRHEFNSIEARRAVHADVAEHGGRADVTH